MASLASARPLPSVTAAAGAVDADWRRRLIVLLGAQSVLLVLTSVNRLSDLTTAPVLPHDALRVVELVNLLVLPPLSALGWYLLLEHLLRRGADRRARWRLRLAFAAALYLFALSYGMHEPANYLSERFCDGAGGGLCAAIAYQDDQLSHFLFFAGFAGIQAVLLVAQAAVAAATPAVTTRERTVLLANAVLVAAAIVANLAFEEIGPDLAVIAVLAAAATWLLRRRGPAPVLVYFAVANVAGLMVTAALKLA